MLEAKKAQLNQEKLYQPNSYGQPKSFLVQHLKIIFKIANLRV